MAERVNGSAADALIASKEDLARATTDALYDQRPDLLEKHGASGRAKCLQDMRYNLEHLAPAVALNRPDMFADYIRWVDNLLRSRGVATDELALSLELMQQVAEEQLSGVDLTTVRACISAGSAALLADGI